MLVLPPVPLSTSTNKSGFKSVDSLTVHRSIPIRSLSKIAASVMPSPLKSPVWADSLLVEPKEASQISLDCVRDEPFDVAVVQLPEDESQ